MMNRNIRSVPALQLLKVVLLALVFGALVPTNCKKRDDPPGIPTVPFGPPYGRVGAAYSFSSAATDPDSDSVAIRFDWDDGDTSHWSDWVRPGDTVTMSHTWSAPGSFSVRAAAQTRYSDATDWSSAFATAIYYEWVWRFGGAGFDSVISVRQTLDGGYIATGSYDVDGEAHPRLLLVKTDAAGNSVWTRMYGGDMRSWGRSVVQARDGGYVVAGCRWANGWDLWLIKTDGEGNAVWDKTYGGPGYEEGYSVQQTEDGGYVVSGLGSGVWLLKTDASGDTAWTRTFGHGWCEGRSVQQTRDGGFVIAVQVCSNNPPDTVLLIKTDARGEELWVGRFAEDPVYYSGMSVQQNDDGGYVVCSTGRHGERGGNDALLLRTDSLGQVLWTKSYGGVYDDWANSVVETPDGGFIIVGNTASYTTFRDHDVWLIETDANGDTLWTRTYGWADNDMGYSVQLASDGGYIIAGRTWSEGPRVQVLLIKTDAEGRLDLGDGQ